MFGISGTELVIILFFGFLIFGPEKLPQIGRTVGRAIRQFREASETMNQKFKDEVYDPFKDAVEPYAEQVNEATAPMKNDLDAINKTFTDTRDLLKDPLGLKNSSSRDMSSTNFDKSGNPTIKSMVNDMVHDPLDRKKHKDDAGDEGNDAEADVAKPEGQPLPKTGGKVKVGLAESLYNLDAEAAPVAAAPATDASAAPADPAADPFADLDASMKGGE